MPPTPEEIPTDPLTVNGDPCEAVTERPWLFVTDTEPLTVQGDPCVTACVFTVTPEGITYVDIAVGHTMGVAVAAGVPTAAITETAVHESQPSIFCFQPVEGVEAQVKVGVAVNAGEGVNVGDFVSVTVRVGVKVSVMDLVAVGVGVFVAAGEGVNVFVTVFVERGVFVRVGENVKDAVRVGVAVGVQVGVQVGVRVGVIVAVTVGEAVGVAVPVSVKVDVTVDVGVSAQAGPENKNRNAKKARETVMAPLLCFGKEDVLHDPTQAAHSVDEKTLANATHRGGVSVEFQDVDGRGELRRAHIIGVGHRGRLEVKFHNTASVAAFLNADNGKAHPWHSGDNLNIVAGVGALETLVEDGSGGNAVLQPSEHGGLLSVFRHPRQPGRVEHLPDLNDQDLDAARCEKVLFLSALAFGAREVHADMLMGIPTAHSMTLCDAWLRPVRR